MSAFRIRPDRPVGAELARVMRAQLKAARTRLEAWPADPEAAFHEARRRLKKVRAAARVAREVDKPLAKEINALCRKAGQELGGARDFDVVSATAAKLARTCKDPAAAAALTRLAEHAARAAPAEADRDALAVGAGAKISEALDGARRIGETDAPRKALKRAAARAIRRADRAYLAAQAAASPGPETAELRHEWRKRVKELWYVERLLAKVWPLDRSVDDALTNTLGKKLGEERDLLLLAARLQHGARACGGASGRDAALAHVQDRRARVVARADRLGRRLHREAADRRRARADRSLEHGDHAKIVPP